MQTMAMSQNRFTYRLASTAPESLDKTSCMIATQSYAFARAASARELRIGPLTAPYSLFVACIALQLVR